ncbi:uncharacterized protein LOC113005705 [Solenopsis invicta]|uniref:uncharacterized protein LOC113005705 n=1 Tax=Solenopsis invicta TaxID=13686 RepID=UPI00193DC1D8|nr:uncharacterized protein LOC113005705 [Solenopsis invicta]
MEKGQVGEVVGKEKIWTITYADDIVLLAERQAELKEMMKRFRKYLEKKELSLSADKSKVLVFENGRGRRKKREWKWKKENIEEVKEIRYLGYMLQKKESAEKHTRERLRRVIAMKRTWSIEERIFKEDFRRRIKIFEALVRSVALYGAEVWDWRDEKTLDGIKRKYAKWILSLDRRTPNYILLEETKMEEIRIQAIKRALTIRYEKKREKENSEGMHKRSGKETA